MRLSASSCVMPTPRVIISVATSALSFSRCSGVKRSGFAGRSKSELFWRHVDIASIVSIAAVLILRARTRLRPPRLWRFRPPRAWGATGMPLNVVVGRPTVAAMPLIIVFGRSERCAGAVGGGRGAPAFQGRGPCWLEVAVRAPLLALLRVLCCPSHAVMDPVIVIGTPPSSPESWLLAPGSGGSCRLLPSFFSFFVRLPLRLFEPAVRGVTGGIGAVGGRLSALGSPAMFGAWSQ
mmetsp:Transcript_24974/g.85467  ORF Transcript_24974/g.85467 Transcript_24974/m.85467 type:complete len:236 (+) Transcript_24974:644-1351(+)